MTKKSRKLHDTSRIEIVEEAASETPVHDSFIERMYGGNASWLISIILVFGCVVIYYQVSGFKFVNFDDNIYVYRNPHVLGGLSWENLKWAFTSFDASNWHPLTWLSHQLDATLFGNTPGAHHLTSVAIHAVNSLLVFFTLRLLTGATWKSGVVAGLFAFHPTHVESVAWVAERKDVLSTLFWLFTTLFYAKYTAKDSAATRNYSLALIFFALGLMAKPMLVTLPFALLLLDFWPLGRIKKISWDQISGPVIEKLPFFALAAASSVVTYFVQKVTGAVVALDYLPVSSRIINAVIAYAKYVTMMFYPVDLGGWYPYQEQGFGLLQIAISAIIVGVITVAAIVYRNRARYLFTGWFWFVGTLVPVIGLVQVGRQSHADRCTYIPYIGLSIAVVWLAGMVIEKRRINKDAVTVVTLCLLIGLGAMSFKQVGYWQDNETFFKRTLAVTEKNFLFEQNYCQFLIDENRLDEAEVQCRNSIANNPSYQNSWLSMGVILMKRNKPEEALTAFENSSRLRPGDIVAFSNLINALIALDRIDEALDKTAQIAGSDAPNDQKKNYLPPLYRLLALKLAGSGADERAIDVIKKSLALDETQADLQANLGLLLYKTGKKDEALAELDRALKLDRNQADLQTAAGRILLEQGKNAEAAAYFAAALTIDPNMKAAREGLERSQSAKSGQK